MNFKEIEKFKNGEIDIFELALLLDKGENIKNKENGIIYTPLKIVEEIIKLTEPSLTDKILEPSVGHGVFIFYLINYMEKKYKLNKIELKDWFENKVYATDINDNSIKELKEMISLFFEKKNIYNINLSNIYTADALFTEYKDINVVVGNPPYIRTKNLNEVYLKKIKENFNSCKDGNIDIYYAFIEKFSGISERFSFIVPNGYIVNKAATKLRELIKEKTKVVIDFKEKLIFDNARTYTSIFLIKNDNDKDIFYKNDLDKEYKKINKKSLNNKKWIFEKNKKEKIISEKDYENITITSSIATLRDYLYILKEPVEEGEFYIQYHNKQKYLIEKSICVDLLKQTKKDIKYFIIFPYEDGKIIKESIFKNSFPKCYEYLLAIKYELDKRDRGKVAKYEEWYAYGRKQGINIKEDSFYFFVPIMMNDRLQDNVKKIKDKFVVTSGFCIESKDIEILEKIRKAFTSEEFVDYYKKEGKPWPGKKVYYTITSKQVKEYIKNED